MITLIDVKVSSGYGYDIEQHLKECIEICKLLKIDEVKTNFNGVKLTIRLDLKISFLVQVYEYQLKINR